MYELSSSVGLKWVNGNKKSSLVEDFCYILKEISYATTFKNLPKTYA